MLESRCGVNVGASGGGPAWRKNMASEARHTWLALYLRFCSLFVVTYPFLVSEMNGL